MNEALPTCVCGFTMAAIWTTNHDGTLHKTNYCMNANCMNAKTPFYRFGYTVEHVPQKMPDMLKEAIDLLQQTIGRIDQKHYDPDGSLTAKICRLISAYKDTYGKRL